MAERLKVLLLAPNVDGTDVGEPEIAYHLVRAMIPRMDLTVLAWQRSERMPVPDQLPGAEVHTWIEPERFRRYERFNAMAKPSWPIFCHHVRGWLRRACSAGRRFDIAHQMLPHSARYATPLRDQGMPYLVGPVGGSLPTPPGFVEEVGGSERWFVRKLRGVDGLRFRRDPWLRAGFGRAEIVLGVAPYMREVLRDMPMKRFEPFLGIGVTDLAPDLARPVKPGALRLLHVGRGVRTKGLRDAVRALALLPDLPEVTLTSAGKGEEIELCRAEAEALGVGHRTTFLGGLTREAVEELYPTHDAFLFPSFRESMGGVLYEAMRWGLPAITVDHGGPGFIVDESCGLKARVTDPETMARDLADQIRHLAGDPALYARLSAGARERVRAEALWSAKAARLESLYREALASAGAEPRS